MAKPKRVSWAARGLRFLVFRSKSRDVHGIPVHVFDDEPRVQAAAYAKLEQALLLLETHDPRAFHRLSRNVPRVMVWWLPNPVAAQWDSGLEVVSIDDSYLARDSTDARELASTLVHEATHAWLSRLGVGADGHAERHEVIAIRAELSFAKRLPGAHDLVEATARRLADQSSHLVDETEYVAGLLQPLRQWGVPAFLTEALGSRLPALRRGTRAR